MRNPERQNSVNEVIRSNLKAIGRVSASIVLSMQTKAASDDLSSLLFEVKSNDSMLTNLVRMLADKNIVKGTFLCQFVASDGLIGLCKLYNHYKSFFLNLQQTDKSNESQTNKTLLYLIERFALQIIVKLNTLIMPFCKIQKDNQAYANPAQNMAADTEPRKY